MIYSAFLLLSILFSSFFWRFFNPIFNFNDVNFFKSIYLVFLNQFQKSPSTFYLENGIFYKDYFLIKNKPIFKSLLIDDHTAIAVINKKREKRILLKGFHIIRPGEQVVHVINLNFHHFYYDPKDHSNTSIQSISRSENNKTQPSLIRNNQVSSKLRTSTKDVPRFSVYTNYKHNENNEKMKQALNRLSNYFSRHNISGELISHLENLIGESVFSIWETFTDKNVKDVTSSHWEISQQIADKAILLINAYLNNSETNMPGFSENQLLFFSEATDFLRKLDLINIRVFINDVRTKH
jgi:hypothetical protein